MVFQVPSHLEDLFSILSPHTKKPLTVRQSGSTLAIQLLEDIHDHFMRCQLRCGSRLLGMERQSDAGERQQAYE